MLEAKLNEAAILKRLMDAVKELVSDANFECNEEGINLQAMDNSHVALVSVKLDASGFRKYRCDRPIPLGVNLVSLTKVIKCAKDDDLCTLKASDDGDILSLTYEARNSDRIAEYEVKLMDIESDTLGIPDTDYEARVTMPSSEFTRIVRDLSQLGESVRIEVSKEGVRFVSDGEAANGSILLKQTEAARDRYADYGQDDDKDEEDDVEMKDEGEGDDDDEEKPKKIKKEKIKKEKVKKEEREDEDEEEEGKDDDDEGEFKAKSDDEGEEEVSDSETKKKRKKAPTMKGKAKKKAKKSEEDDLPPGGVSIEMTQHVTLTFSLKYLVNFSKSAALSDTVQLMLKNDVPLLVSYSFGQGHIRYYLAPKIGDD